jgi:hypothetical protein
MDVNLLGLMFGESLSDEAERLAEVSAMCAPDLLAWDELSDRQKIDLFGKLVNARHAIDHCLEMNFNVDPASLPATMNDCKGADAHGNWYLQGIENVPGDITFAQAVKHVLANEAM